jgi:hypothetical protein
LRCSGILETAGKIVVRVDRVLAQLERGDKAIIRPTVINPRQGVMSDI